MTFYPTGKIPPLAEATEPAFMAGDIFHGFENFVHPIASPCIGKRSQTHGRLERKRARPRVWDGPFLAQRTRWHSRLGLVVEGLELEQVSVALHCSLLVLGEELLGALGE